MPYINQEDRPQYQQIINEVLDAIHSESDALIQVEYFGVFAWKVIIGTVKENPFRKPYKPGGTEDELFSKMLALGTQASHCLASKGIITQGGQLNYLLSTIAWGLLGDDPRFELARYSTRAYMRGILLSIQDETTEFYTSTNAMLRGVLGDVLDELYRRKTSVYEDMKIEETGDLWDSTELCDCKEPISEFWQFAELNRLEDNVSKMQPNTASPNADCRYPATH